MVSIVYDRRCAVHIYLADYWVLLSTFRFRAEIPTHISWASDSSLLAVSLGAYVTIYDPTTTNICQILTWPECKFILSAHFIGRGSRFLVVHGTRDIILWDLVIRSSEYFPLIHCAHIDGLLQPVGIIDLHAPLIELFLIRMRVISWSLNALPLLLPHHHQRQFLFSVPCPLLQLLRTIYPFAY